MKKTLAHATLMASAALAAGSAQADLVYDFNGSSTYGFTLLGGLLSYQQAGGNGYLVLEDGPGNVDLGLLVPLKPFGNWDSWSQYLGGTLSFDVQFINEVSSVTPAFGTITLTKLFSGGQSISVDVVAQTAVSGNGWTTYSIALTPETGWGSSLAAVLAAPQSVLINFETGSTDSNRALIGIDNVRVTSAVPEPSSGLLSAMGLLGLAFMMRRRQA